MLTELRFVLRAEGSLRNVVFAMRERFGHGATPVTNESEWMGKAARTCLLRGSKGTGEMSFGGKDASGAVEIDVLYNPCGWYGDEYPTKEFNEINFGQFVGEFAVNLPEE